MSDIKKFIEGSKEFKKKFFIADNTLFNELVQYGQKPKAMIIACSDSRVDPAIIFNCKPGDLFVVRNVANLVPPCEGGGGYHGTSAALEFAIQFLKVEHVIILGHTQCGGIQALLSNSEAVLDKEHNSFIAKWMEIARPAYDRVMANYSDVSFEDKVTFCEQYVLINSLNNLQSFPWIKERLSGGKLSLHAWYFDLNTGDINMYDQQKDEWIK